VLAIAHESPMREENRQQLVTLAGRAAKAIAG
jgi:hypothetical protein